MSKHGIIYLQLPVWDYICGVENSPCSSCKLNNAEFLFLFNCLPSPGQREKGVKEKLVGIT